MLDQPAAAPISTTRRTTATSARASAATHRTGGDEKLWLDGERLDPDGADRALSQLQERLTRLGEAYEKLETVLRRRGVDEPLASIVTQGPGPVRSTLDPTTGSRT